MQTKDIIKIICDFADKHYPKGNENRGYALVVSTLLLMELNEEDSKYTIIKKTDD